MIIKHSSMRKIFHVNDLVFVIPLPLLTMLLAILLEETTLKGGEGGGQCYISQMHVKQIFWVKKAGFSSVSQHFCNWLSLVMQRKPGDLSKLDYILFIKLPK